MFRKRDLAIDAAVTQGRSGQSARRSVTCSKLESNSSSGSRYSPTAATGALRPCGVDRPARCSSKQIQSVGRAHQRPQHLVFKSMRLAERRINRNCPAFFLLVRIYNNDRWVRLGTAEPQGWAQKEKAPSRGLKVQSGNRGQKDTNIVIIGSAGRVTNCESIFTFQSQSPWGPSCLVPGNGLL